MAVCAALMRRRALVRCPALVRCRAGAVSCFAAVSCPGAPDGLTRYAGPARCPGTHVFVNGHEPAPVHDPAATSACRGGRQAKLAPDHADRRLYRCVGRGEPALVPAELAQGGGGGGGRGEPGPGLVHVDQLAGNCLRGRRERKGEEAPVEQPLGGGRVPQDGLGGGEIIAVWPRKAVEVMLEALVR